MNYLQSHLKDAAFALRAVDCGPLTVQSLVLYRTFLLQRGNRNNSLHFEVMLP